MTAPSAHRHEPSLICTDAVYCVSCSCSWRFCGRDVARVSRQWAEHFRQMTCGDMSEEIKENPR
jgi:hypothetical protein